jgi:hypothetical protein
MRQHENRSGKDQGTEQAGGHHELHQHQLMLARAHRLRQRRAAARANQSGDVAFSDDEAGVITGSTKGHLAQSIEGGADGVKEREGRDPFEGDSLAADGVGRGAEDVAEEVKEGAAKTAGLAAGARALFVPRIVSLVRHHEYGEALHVLSDSVGPEERVEIAKAVLERLAGELSPQMLAVFERAAFGAAIYSVLDLGWEWFKLGTESIHEAHERGDRDSANAIFAWAYADTLLNGSHSNPGAITAEQIEARDRGIEMSRKAREQCPELPDALRAEYGNGRNALHAVEDGLLTRAGIQVRSHHGR